MASVRKKDYVCVHICNENWGDGGGGIGRAYFVGWVGEGGYYRSTVPLTRALNRIRPSSRIYSSKCLLVEFKYTRTRFTTQSQLCSGAGQAQKIYIFTILACQGKNTVKTVQVLTILLPIPNFFNPPPPPSPSDTSQLYCKTGQRLYLRDKHGDWVGDWFFIDVLPGLSWKNFAILLIWKGRHKVSTFILLVRYS